MLYLRTITKCWFDIFSNYIWNLHEEGGINAPIIRAISAHIKLKMRRKKSF